MTRARKSPRRRTNRNRKVEKAERNVFDLTIRIVPESGRLTTEEKIERLWLSGRHSIADIAEILDVDVTTVMEVVEPIFDAD
jgi:hypothetical protein